MYGEVESTPEVEVPTLLPRRVLGRTGRAVSILGLGGGGLFFKEENRDLAYQVLNRAIDLGINYFDTAPTYGASEILFGEVLKDRRNEVFLATKVYPRTRVEAWKTIENSLIRLKTDVIDLLQVHDIRSKEEVDQLMKPNGSLAAIMEAQEQGLVRWIGVTSHYDPDVLLFALGRFDFDTVLMPVNVVDKHYYSFIESVLPVAEDRNLGVIGMKVYCVGDVFDQLEITPAEALQYALSFPIATAVVGVENLQQLLENIDIVRHFKPMTEEEQQEVLNRTREKAVVCSSKFKRKPTA
jgi:aryl-alcohol dehydrogenase-like predicted oxidoreductase